MARLRAWLSSRAAGEPMTRGARHAFITLLVAGLAVAGASPAFTVMYANSTASQLREQVLASCSFAGDLGSAPLPATPRPSRLGVAIVADARAWWHRNHCPGTLPPSPGLAHWAAYYHLPAS